MPDELVGHLRIVFLQCRGDTQDPDDLSSLFRYLKVPTRSPSAHPCKTTQQRAFSGIGIPYDNMKIDHFNRSESSLFGSLCHSNILMGASLNEACMESVFKFSGHRTANFLSPPWFGRRIIIQGPPACTLVSAARRGWTGPAARIVYRA